MRTNLGAEWISPQVRVKRPLRGGEGDFFSGIKNPHKRSVFQTILKREVPRGDFGEDFEDSRAKPRMGRRDIQAHRMDESESEYDQAVLAAFTERQSKFEKEHKPWEIVKDPLFRDQWHIHGNHYRRFSFESNYREESMPTFHLNLAPVNLD